MVVASRVSCVVRRSRLESGTLRASRITASRITAGGSPGPESYDQMLYSRARLLERMFAQGCDMGQVE